jgi:hypothetical protein
MMRVETAGARTILTFAATVSGSFAAALTGTSGAAQAAPAGSPPIVAHVPTAFNGWSLGFGVQADWYRNSVSGELYAEPFSQGLNPTDVNASLEIGHDWRHGNTVYGLYGDIFLGHTSSGFPSSDDYIGNLSLGERASVTGHIGTVVSPNTQIYGLFGWSVQKYDADYFGSSESGFINGPTIGVGGEWLMPAHPNTSFKAEFRFTHLSAPGSFPVNEGDGAIFSSINDSSVRLIYSIKLPD